jgi:hypothetical protein
VIIPWREIYDNMHQLILKGIEEVLVFVEVEGFRLTTMSGGSFRKNEFIHDAREFVEANFEKV